MANKTVNSLYLLTFCTFALLIFIRESATFGHVFNFLPLLGGSIPYFFLTISLIFIYQYQGYKLSKLGLSWPNFAQKKYRSLLLLLLFALLIFFIGLVAGSVVMESFDLIQGTEAAFSIRKSPLVGNLTLLWLLTPLMWIAVIDEELLFRGFMMNFFAQKFGVTTKSWLLAIFNIFANFWFSALVARGAWFCRRNYFSVNLGAAYFHFGRNLWPVIIAHSMANTIGFISSYNN